MYTKANDFLSGSYCHSAVLFYRIMLHWIAFPEAIAVTEFNGM